MGPPGTEQPQTATPPSCSKVSLRGNDGGGCRDGESRWEWRRVRAAGAHGGDFPRASTLAAFSLTAAPQETRIQERAEVAQLVEHSTENAGVAGSIPALGARAARSSPSGSSSAVEHFLAKEEVAGSNPVSRPTQRRRQQSSMSGCGAVGSARRSGRRGRWFKSSHPDHPHAPARRRISRIASLDSRLRGNDVGVVRE